MTVKDLLDPNPFAKPLFAKTGDKLARDIYTSVGFALDRWERCEISFGTLYSCLVKPEGSNHTLMRAFGVISAASTRFEMIWHATDAFFAAHPNEDLRAETRHLLNIYKSAAARRNEIAHAVVDGNMPYIVENKEAVLLPTVWFLVPPLFATRKTEMFARGPKYRYSTKEIGQFTACFEELGTRAMNLMQRIRSFYAASPQKHP